MQIVVFDCSSCFPLVLFFLICYDFDFCLETFDDAGEKDELQLSSALKVVFSFAFSIFV